MEIVRYSHCGKEITLYLSGKENSPLIILNNYEGDGKPVADAMGKAGADKIDLLCVGGLNWDHDMSPWYCPPLFKNDSPCTGGADAYLEQMVTEIIPKAKGFVNGEPSHLGIAGYSLAGLFAVYAMYRTDVFDRVASMSGSLWFPDFREYCMEHEIKRKPDKIYLSLGDKEDRTRNKLMMTVRENTEALVEYYRGLGLDVDWELNPGNHFRDADIRSAKGIMAVI